MGRRKYHMHGKQHGRNMLICEYIWIAWKQQTLPPGAPAPPQYTMQEVKPCQCKPPKKPHRDDEQCWVKVKHDWYRERKQVSSHIQVIKNFFRFHPACECLRLLFVVILSSFIFDFSLVPLPQGLARSPLARHLECPSGDLEPIDLLGTRQKCCAQLWPPVI